MSAIATAFPFGDVPCAPRAATAAQKLRCTVPGTVWGDRFAAPHGLSSARWQVLGAIAMAPQPPNVPQIAAAMGITRQGALKQTRLLVAEGMVRLQPNPAHRRSPLHVLTPKGQAAYDAVVGRWHAHARAMARQFDAEELEVVARVLDGLSQSYGGALLAANADQPSGS